MALNKVRPGSNMYQFITHTWNPLGGKCLHGCTYCSTNKFYYPVLKEKYSGPPRLYDDYLDDNLGAGNFIFVVAQNDLFAEGIPDKWLYNVLGHCIRYDNSYLFQSKNPKYILGSSAFLPKKSVICTTIETNRHYPEIMKESPPPIDRARWMTFIDLPKYVTIEPIMDFDFTEMVILIQACNPIQVNIGADSGNNNLPEPSKEKLLALIDELKKFTVINNKSNLSRILNQ